MTPKEKALSISNSFRTVNFRDVNGYKDLASSYDCKQCALIVVNEILNVWENQQPRRFEEWLEIFEYWKEVKSEIKKL